MGDIQKVMIVFSFDADDEDLEDVNEEKKRKLK